MTIAPVHVVEHNLLTFRHTWRAYATSLVVPFLFLAAMGLGLGSLVDRRGGSVQGVSYLVFIAPGLMAASAMQAGAAEGAWPIMGKIRWNRIYHSMLASPLSIDDLLLGELATMALRLLVTSGVFFVAMLVFGTVRSGWGVLAWPSAALTGLAFATPVTALSAVLRNDSGYSLLFRLGIVPLFLLGGAFFPIDRLPGAVQVVAWVTPLYHGVALARGLTMGGLQLPVAAVHVAVQLLYVIAGLLIARYTFRRQLQP
jgi:lipooligosaccharide transport system permease protein